MTPPFDPQQIEAIFFDLDGTLIDTDDLAVSALAQRLGPLARYLKRDPQRVARRLVMWAETPGNRLVTFFDWLGLDDNIFRLGDKLRSWRGLRPRARLPLVPGVAEMLAALKPHYRLGVVTTRGRRDARSFIEQHRLGGLFEIVVTRETTLRLKPHPAPVLYALRKLQLPADRCLMVGDTTADVLAGRRAGAWTVAVLCGFGERPELEKAGAHRVLDSTAHLPRALGVL
ncbi:MAG: HAD family hydrolase [Anaerolineae bacterium]